MNTHPGGEQRRPHEEQLLEAIRRIAVIDAHSHLLPEPQHVAQHRDALTVYGQYTRLPMFASGLSEEDWLRIHDPAIPLEERWALAKPYIFLVRHTSFARAARQVLKHFWNVEELADHNIHELSQRIAAENRPGIYERVLRKECNIVHVLNQNSPPPDDRRELDVYQDQQLLQPVVALIDPRPPQNLDVNRMGGNDGFLSLDGYLDWARHRLRALAEKGAVGFKTFALDYGDPDRDRALADFSDLKRRQAGLAYDMPTPLLSYIHDELLKAAAAFELVVAVHTGFWGVHRHHPRYMMPILERHPNIRFDLFHSGIPYVREMGLIGVNFRNVTVNLCWAHSINAAMTRSALDEYLDTLGSDKVIAFGSDVRWMVEKVYGHLELARQNIASVLASRIDRGLMNFEEALRLAKEWLFDNPARLYKLPVVLD